MAHQGHVFSPSLLGFYANMLRPSYEAANSWPPDPVEITDDVWAQYAGTTAPPGQTLGADVTGQPIWVDLPPPPPPTLAQQATAMITAGIQIVSTGNPALNGTYSCSALASSQEASLLAALTAGLDMPNGVIVRVDTDGQAHDFTPTEFKDYYQVKMVYQQDLNTIIGTGQGTLPAQPSVIA
jgi:hypothetical protein